MPHGERDDLPADVLEHPVLLEKQHLGSATPTGIPARKDGGVVVPEEGFSAKLIEELRRRGHHFAAPKVNGGGYFTLFPNFHPWPLFNRICYLFRPYKDDPDRSWMDVYQLMPFDKKKGRPPAAARPHGASGVVTFFSDLPIFPYSRETFCPS